MPVSTPVLPSSHSANPRRIDAANRAVIEPRDRAPADRHGRAVALATRLYRTAWTVWHLAPSQDTLDLRLQALRLLLDVRAEGGR